MYSYLLTLLVGLGFLEDQEEMGPPPDIDDPVEPSGGAGDRRRRGFAAWGGGC